MNDIKNNFLLLNWIQNVNWNQFYLKGLPSILAKLIFGLIPIDINSWNKSLQAYGIFTWKTAFPLQFLQTFECLKNPHPSQISTVV